MLSLGPIISLCVIFLISGIILGAAIYANFAEYTEHQVMQITQKIEEVKEKDLAAYSNLKNEWSKLLEGHLSIPEISSDLLTIIESIKKVI